MHYLLPSRNIAKSVGQGQYNHNRCGVVQDRVRQTTTECEAVKLILSASVVFVVESLLVSTVVQLAVYEEDNAFVVVVVATAGPTAAPREFASG